MFKQRMLVGSAKPPQFNGPWQVPIILAAMIIADGTRIPEAQFPPAPIAQLDSRSLAQDAHPAPATKQDQTYLDPGASRKPDGVPQEGFSGPEIGPNRISGAASAKKVGAA